MDTGCGSGCGCPVISAGAISFQAMTDILDDEELSPPGKPDFRRVGRWNSPQVVMPNGKRSTYGRFSNAGKLLDDESNLNDWKLCTTVYGAAFRPELMAQASTLHLKADRNVLRDIAEQCLTSGKGKERSVKGEAIHSMFDHLDMDDGWEPAPQWKELCDAYLATLNLWGLHATADECEINCVSHEFRLAGRMDRRYKTRKVLVTPDNRTIPIGSMIAADTKTGAVLEYAAGSYATQLAGYSVADKYDVTTDETIAFDPPTYQDWGLIIHADSASTEVQIYWVDLRAGLEGLKLSQEIKGWRQRADLLTLGAGPVMATSLLPVAPVVPQDASRVTSLLTHTRERVRAILAHSDIAGKALARNWPEGIPGLKAGGHTWEQLQEVIEVVERVETDYSVPFFPPWDDPEIAASMQKHPSNDWADKLTKPTITSLVESHPRKELLWQWLDNAPLATEPTIRALVEFASINTDGWLESVISVDEQLTTFLEGTLRAMGYTQGLSDLNNLTLENCAAIISAALSVTAGTAMLLYQEDGTCILRANIRLA